MAVLQAALFLVIVLVVGLLGIIGLDAALRLTMSDAPTISSYKTTNPEKKDTLYLFLGPSGVKGDKVTPELRKFLRDRGDVKDTTYNPKRFKAETMIDFLIPETTGYKRVVIVGLSIGYPLGFLLAEKIQSMSTGQELYLLGIDPAGSAATLKMGGEDWMKGVLTVVQPGPILNLLSPLVGRITFKPADINTIHPRNEEDLHALWDSYRNNPISGWRDQVMFFHEFDGFHALPGVKTGVVQSTKDTVVDSDEAYEEARMINSGLPIPRHRVHGAGHVSVLDWPDEFEAALEALLKELQLI